MADPDGDEGDASPPAHISSSSLSADIKTWNLTVPVKNTVNLCPEMFYFHIKMRQNAPGGLTALLQARGWI